MNLTPKSYLDVFERGDAAEALGPGPRA
jgi:hypothetical protein